MIIQIYEVNNPAEARELVKMGVNHTGVLVGKGKYPRELNFETARKIFEALPEEAKGVALTLESDLSEITELIEKTNPDILHIGTILENFSPDNIRKLKSRFPSLKFMRAIPVINERSIEAAKSYDGIADYLLLDSYKSGREDIGATGETHNWDISRRIVESVKIPVILAGGLGPDNVAEAIQKVRPAGVDSKTKTDKPGTHQKDIEKVKEFVKVVRSFE